MKRSHFNWLFIGAMCIAIASTVSGTSADDVPAATSPQPARLLFVTQSFGFKHSVVNRKNEPLSTAERAIVDWGDSSKLYYADCTQNVAKDLTKENLQNYDIVMFYTTGDRAQWPLDEATFDYFLNDWVKQKGHGFVGVHSAADTLKDYKPYYEMLGGTFDQHPWHADSKVTVVIDDPNHPICAPWGKEFTITDEIYQFKNWNPENSHLLMSLDIGRSKFNEQIKRDIKHEQIPIAWCKENGDGKMFHMSLGHNEAVWADPRYRDSILGGIKWILGQVPGDAKPNPDVSAAELAKGKADIAAKTAELDSK